MEIPTNRSELLEDEWYHVRHSGEIPEIALHSTIYHLTEDQDGPGIEISDLELSYLQGAAQERYLEIILRDITPKNRNTTIYRGILRTISNWRRYKRFCVRNGMDELAIRHTVIEQVLSFLENEIKDVRDNSRESCINCTFEDIASFGAELDFSLKKIEADLRPLCRNF